MNPKLLCLISAIAGIGSALAAEAYPLKPVRVVTPFAAGSPVETMMRAVGDRFSEQTGQPFIIEARPGASGNIAATTVARAPADGYTLLAAIQAVMTINPHVYRKLDFDPLADFAPISMTGRSHLFFVANLTVPARTLAEFVSWARANPGKVSFASLGAGTPSHFIGVLFNQAAHLDMLHVPYKGSAPAALDILGGQIPVGFVALGSIRAHLQSGKLKALAVTAATRSPSQAQIPTFAEQGFPAIETYTWAGLVAPARTPAEIIARLNAEVVRALAHPSVKERLAASDQEAAPTSPQEFDKLIRADSARWAQAIKASGFKLEE